MALQEPVRSHLRRIVLSPPRHISVCRNMPRLRTIAYTYPVGPYFHAKSVSAGNLVKLTESLESDIVTRKMIPGPFPESRSGNRRGIRCTQPDARNPFAPVRIVRICGRAALRSCPEILVPRPQRVPLFQRSHMWLRSNQVSGQTLSRRAALSASAHGPHIKRWKALSSSPPVCSVWYAQNTCVWTAGSATCIG